MWGTSIHVDTVKCKLKTNLTALTSHAFLLQNPARWGEVRGDDGRTGFDFSTCCIWKVGQQQPAGLYSLLQNVSGRDREIFLSLDKSDLFCQCESSFFLILGSRI